ncbi:hypothetical protein [Xanthomonas sacchari]|uniref:hypothetical protein n=1 Tax=Xanthomonas sacchari TaxID=56458 RepID=UPI00225814AA|nr:hypothetical protein [Xanthomonas sacchari]MCW0392666.1 hypothetical protein [Xanthomonas sacchari]
MSMSNVRKNSIQWLCWPYWPALLLGVLVASWVVPYSLIFGSGGFDLVQQDDMAQHLAGQRYFIADAWRWPILNYANANMPYGANVVMSDSVPLLALVLKALGLRADAVNGTYMSA